MDIVEELRQDREAGAKRLESEYRAGLLAMARRLCSDLSDADELVNRTFAAVVAGIDDYLEQSAFFGWMCRIMINLNSADRRRRSDRDVTYPGDLPETADDAAHEAIYRDVDASILRDAINTLPKEMKEAIVMHYLMEQPVARIAKFLALPVSTVKWRIHCARVELTRRLTSSAKRPGVKAVLLALALSALAAVGAVGVAAIRSAPEPAAEEAEIVFNTKNTEDTEGSLEVFEGLGEECLSLGSAPTNREVTAANSEINNEGNAMNIQSVKSAAVKALAAGAMLAATAAGADPVLGVSPTANTADSRAIAIADMQLVDGAVVSVDISLEPIFCATGTLYAAFADADMGDNLSAWPNVAVAAQTVTEADSSVRYVLPAGWGGDGYKIARFFLISSVLRAGDYAQRLEYIDSSSTSDVDTGVRPVGSSRVEGGIMRTVDADQIAVHGVGGTGLTTWIGSKDNLSCRFMGRAACPNMQAKDLWYYFVQSSANFYYEDGNGVTKTAEYSGGSATVSTTLHLFNNGTDSTYRNALRLAYWRHYTNDVLASSYIPVLRSDGVTADLWDVVNGRSANCPGLTAGPVVNFGTSFTNVTGTFSAVRVIPSSNYIQDGLVAQWDGIENGGTGSHWDIAANGWKDLVGGLVLTKMGGEPATDTTGVSLGSKVKLQVYDANGLATALGRVLGSTTKTVEIVGRDCTSGAQNSFLYAMDGLDSGKTTMGRLFMWYTDSSTYILGTVAMPISNGISWFEGNDFGLNANEDFSAAIVQPSAAQCLRYSNGQACGSVAVANVVDRSDRSSAAISLHGWYDKEGSTQTAYISAIRIYNRALTAQEIARNHALDAIRFRGESADGYRISNGRWQVRIRATSEDPSAVVAVGNVSGAEVETWVDLSSEVEISVRQFPVGKALRRWEDGSAVSYDERMKFAACYPVNAVAKLAVKNWTYANGELTNGDWTFAASGANSAIVVGKTSVTGSVGAVDFTGEISVAGGGTGSIAGFVDEMFRYNSAIEVLRVPESVKSIPQRMVAQCPNLRKVILHDGITNISHRAFRDTPKLYSFTPMLPQRLQSLGAYAFQLCPLLNVSVFIPRTLTTCIEDEGDWRNSAYFDLEFHDFSPALALVKEDARF